LSPSALPKKLHSSPVTIEGSRLEYQWHGPPASDAPTIVFLHEGLGSITQWRDFFELTRVTFVGSVAERREMPSDCRCERSAKWSHLSRAKRVRLNTTTKCTRPLSVNST